MESLMKEIPLAPKDLCAKIMYDAKASWPQVLLTRKETEAELRLWFDSLSDEQWKPLHSVVFHPAHDDLMYVGPPDISSTRGDRELEALWLRTFRKDPGSPAQGSRENILDPSPVKAIPASNLKYPFDKLQALGEHFFVPNGNIQLISTYASNWKKFAGQDKIITCRDIPGGVIVMLVYDPSIDIHPLRFVQP